MGPTAAAVMASSPISAPVGTTIWPPFSFASAIRSSFSSNAPTLSTTAVLPRDITGATMARTSLLGAHSTTMSAASASASIGSAAGRLLNLPSQPRCFSMSAEETAASVSPSIPSSMALASRDPIGPRPAMATRATVLLTRLISLEAIVETAAVRLQQADRRIREMDRQDQRVGVGDGGKEFPPRYRRQLRIPVRPRRPVDLAALDRVMHEIAGDHRALAPRVNVDAAMAGRMPRRRRQRDGVVERVVVVDEERLSGFHDRQAIVAEHRAGRIVAFLVLLLPHRV